VASTSLIKDLKPIILETLKWLGLSAILSVFVGSFGALFLYGLEWAFQTRNTTPLLIWLLPIGGLLVGLLYYKWGKEVEGGNNLIIQEIISPTKPISFLMAPFVLFGTVVTHLFGGSAGREGTAVQIGASLSNQLSKIFKLNKTDREIVLKAGVAAGFSAVFGTPLAGTIFSLEVAKIGKANYQSITASLFSAILSYLVTNLWGVHHTHYSIKTIGDLNFENFLWAILAGVIFGLGGIAFSLSTKYSSKAFKKIKFAPFRPALGGILFAMIVFGIGYQETEPFHGLGINHILKSFTADVGNLDFLIKILLTALILGSGFKGGEVTPLFFTGATLGNTLSKFIPLERDLLAGMGFVAVFSAAANTPFTTIIMGIELFGSENIYFISIACIVAYIVSGKTGIYKSQLIAYPKSSKLKEHKNALID